MFEFCMYALFLKKKYCLNFLGRLKSFWHEKIQTNSKPNCNTFIDCEKEIFGEEQLGICSSMNINTGINRMIANQKEP